MRHLRGKHSMSYYYKLYETPYLSNLERKEFEASHHQFVSASFKQILYVVKWKMLMEKNLQSHVSSDMIKFYV